MSAPLRDPLATDASLHLLADHLTEALAVGDIEPCLLHVAALDGTGFDLGALPLEGRHPTDVLLGLDAPEGWHAVGLATHGWAYHVAERGDPRRHRRRVHVVTLLSRSGEHAHRTLVEDDDHLRAQLAAEAPAGEQVDLLRRVLGLPTDPPPCDAAAYWATEWLASLVTPDAQVASLADALDRHPAMRLLRRDEAAPDADADAVDILTAFHRVVTWRRMRALAADGRFTVPELDPDLADWLDDGSFARFVLNRCPPLTLLRSRLALHVPADVAEAVLDLLDELGVPETTWPDLIGRPRPAA